MELNNFPHDEQLCAIQLESLYFSHLVSPFFHSSNNISKGNGFALINNITPSEYEIGDLTTLNYTRKKANYPFTVLSLQIPLKRFLSPYITQYYLPSAILVILCWGSFWIPATVYPARIALILTNCLSTCVIIRGWYCFISTKIIGFREAY